MLKNEMIGIAIILIVNLLKTSLVVPTKLNFDVSYLTVLIVLL